LGGGGVIYTHWLNITTCIHKPAIIKYTPTALCAIKAAGSDVKIFVMFSHAFGAVTNSVNRRAIFTCAFSQHHISPLNLVNHFEGVLGMVNFGIVSRLIGFLGTT
jgi:hypothetical protein